ncbi:hypothetical protein ABEB36_011836 [Hypothenemus hampei]|uniref:WD repeat domain-containing protein 83 n=1 Tax=Hypothenemus hampei TaxID=57062 RepID=A0ABD1EDI1_HYPHA
MYLEKIVEIDCDQGAIRAVRFNVDGFYCLTCGSDKKIRLWNPYKSLLLKTYGGHANEVLDACSSCDSSKIVSCSSDKSIIYWDVPTGQPLKRLRGHASTVSCVKFNEQSSMVLSGSHDNTVMCWDMRSRAQTPFQTLKEAKDCITSIKVSDYEILTGSVDCSIRRYDLRNGQCISDFVGAAIVSVSFSNDGQCVLASSSDDVIRLLDRTTGELLGEYTGHKIKDMNIESDISRNDNYIISGSATGHIWFWDLVKGTPRASITHTQKKVLNSLSLHPEKDMVLTACVNSIRLWNYSEEQQKVPNDDSD